jgi:hypothetical protein
MALRNRFINITLPLLFFIALSIPSVSSASKFTKSGYFIGLGLQVLEPRGNGEMVALDGKAYEFDFPWYNAYGLVGITDPGPTGLGWQNDQLLGIRLTAGRRFSQKLVMKGNFSWFVPNSERTYFTPPDELLTNYVDQQESKWYQWNARLQLDYYPFEPIPAWFFTVGYEYAWFSTHLDFDIMGVENNAMTGIYGENYKSVHDTKGFCIGTGWAFPEGQDKYREITMSVVYVSNIYKGDYFQRSGEFNVGGINIEIEFLFFLQPRNE